MTQTQHDQTHSDLHAASHSETARQDTAIHGNPELERRVRDVQTRLAHAGTQDALEAATDQALDAYFSAGVHAGLGHLSALTLARRKTDALIADEASRRAAQGGNA